MSTRIEIFGRTDVGKVRDHNEDNYAICQDLQQQRWGFKRDKTLSLGEIGAVLIVADGMGGTHAGEVASHIAQETIKQRFVSLQELPQDKEQIQPYLEDCLQQAHEAIVQRAKENHGHKGMGTTAIVAWMIGNELFVAWSGDSRCYLYRAGQEFAPLTDDHSLVWKLVQLGQISAEEARTHPKSNIITQSLGDESRPPEPESIRVPLQAGDRVLLCSDGLNGMLPDAEIESILTAQPGTATACDQLVSQANAAGGKDNITVLLLDVRELNTSLPVSESLMATSATLSTESPPLTIPQTQSDQASPTFSWTHPLIIGGVIVLLSLLIWWVVAGSGDRKPDIAKAEESMEQPVPKVGPQSDPVAHTGNARGENMDEPVSKAGPEPPPRQSRPANNKPETNGDQDQSSGDPNTSSLNSLNHPRQDLADRMFTMNSKLKQGLERLKQEFTLSQEDLKKWQKIEKEREKYYSKFRSMFIWSAEEPQNLIQSELEGVFQGNSLIPLEKKLEQLTKELSELEEKFAQ